MTAQLRAGLFVPSQGKFAGVSISLLGSQKTGHRGHA